MSIRVVLVEPEGEINVGLTARVMKNFGFKELTIVNPRVNLERSLPYASHGVDVLREAKIEESIGEALKGSTLIVATSSHPGKGRDVIRVSITPEELAEIVSKLDTGVVCIMFGRESVGLKRSEIALSDILVTIPASIEYPSLNISHAAAIILYELYKKLKTRPSQIFKRNMISELERKLLEKYVDEIVELSSLPTHKAMRSRTVLKRVLFRTGLTLSEAKTLLTLFRKIREKMIIDADGT